MYPRLKNCRFKVGSGARREKRNFQNSQDSHRIIFHLCISNLWASNKLHLVIKSLGSQRRCPSFSFSTLFSVIFSFQPRSRCQGAGRSDLKPLYLSLGSEIFAKPLLWEALVSLSAFLETWLKRVERTCLPAWGKKGRGAPACHSPSGEIQT